MKHNNNHQNNRDRKHGKEKFGHNRNGSPFKHNKKRGHKPWNGGWKGAVNGNGSNSDSGSPKKQHHHQNGIQQYHKTQHNSLNGKSSHAKANGYGSSGNERTFENNRVQKPFFSNKNKVHPEVSSENKVRENHSVAPVPPKGVNKIEKRKDEMINGNSNSGSPKKKLKVVKSSDQPVVDEISTDKNALPVMAARKRLVEEFAKHTTFVIIGETGSGKTTQIPQFIFEEKMHKNRCIAITQPRRIAAISMAKRVAEERGEAVGDTVGFSVRFEDMTSESTHIKYMTDGMLLREAMLDSCLRKYSWIVLDEAHERTIHTDVLFGVVKAAQQTRSAMKTKKRLKVIIMSATMDVDSIKNFFDNCAVLYVQGREHPVTINYLKTPVEDNDYSNAVVKTVFQLHESLPMKEHMLVFMTGQDEIESVAHFIRKVMQSNKFKNLEVRTLYASLSYEAQLEALAPPEEGIRRCILSTNVAETSLTIPGIRVVIDTGKVKTRFHIRGTCIDRLQVVSISQAQAWQRSGRAGRLSAGKCYRLYTVQEFEKMPLFPVPEIQRSNMAGVVLHLAKIGITSPLSFDWIDGPPKEAMKTAVTELFQLGAIVSETEPLELTDAGNLMARIPLDPPLAKILVNAGNYGVVEPVMTILSILSSESLLATTDGKRQGLKKRFCAPEGDLISYLKVYREYKKTATKSSWCKMNGLNLRSLQYAAKVRSHLRSICEKEELKLETTVSGMYENIRRCFFDSLPQNCANLQQGNRYVVKNAGKMGFTAKIHPSSVLFNAKAPIVMFTEIIQVAKDSQLMCHVSLVDPEWLKGNSTKHRAS